MKSDFQSIPASPVHRIRHECCGCANDSCPCIQRVCSHSLFFLMCCGFVVLSSLPRILCIVDAILVLIMYLFSVNRNGMQLGRFLYKDVLEFHYLESAIDVFALAIFRVVILWFCFEYKSQTSAASIQGALVTGVVSVIYLVLKLALGDNSMRMLIIVSLILVCAEVVAFLVVRKRRIMMPTSQAASERDYQAMYENKSEEDDIDQDGNAIALEVSIDPFEVLKFPDSKFVDVNGVVIHYVYSNNPEAKLTLILLHGFGGGAFSWMQTWDSLSAKYSLLAFDRPGFGLSSRPSRGEWKENPYTNEFSMQLVESFLKEFSIQNFLIIAHSTGSNLALELGAKMPDRALGLILVSPSDGLPDFVRTIVKTKLGRAVIIQLVKSELGQVAIQRAWYDPSSVSQEIQERYQAALRVPKWSESLWEMTRVKNKTMISCASELRKSQRVLFVYGEDDKLVSFTETEQLLDLLPLSELIDLSECGHLPQEEKPELFCSTVFNFIEQFPSSK